MGKKTSQPRPPKPTPKPEPKAKKPIFKRWWFWLIIVIIVVVIIIAAVLITRSGSSSEDADLTSATEEEVTTEEDSGDDADDAIVYEDITYEDGDYRYWADTSGESLFTALVAYDADGAVNEAETGDDFLYRESTTDDLGIVIESHLTTDEIHSITLTIADWAEDEEQLSVVMEALTYIAAQYGIPEDADAWTAEILEDMEGTAVSEDGEEDEASASVDVSVQQLLLIEDMIVASYSVEDGALAVEIEAMAGFTD